MEIKKKNENRSKIENFLKLTRNTKLNLKSVSIQQNRFLKIHCFTVIIAYIIIYTILNYAILFSAGEFKSENVEGAEM